MRAILFEGNIFVGAVEYRLYFGLVAVCDDILAGVFCGGVVDIARGAGDLVVVELYLGAAHQLRDMGNYCFSLSRLG